MNANVVMPEVDLAPGNPDDLFSECPTLVGVVAADRHSPGFGYNGRY